MTLERHAQDTAAEIFSFLGIEPEPGQRETVGKLIEKALIEAVLEERERFEKAALDVCTEDRDIAHKLAEAAQHDRDVLIANLSAMR